MMGEPGIIISRRGRHGLRSQRESRADIQSWMLYKLEVTFQDVRVNVISKLKYVLCR